MTATFVFLAATPACHNLAVNTFGQVPLLKGASVHTASWDHSIVLSRQVLSVHLRIGIAGWPCAATG